MESKLKNLVLASIAMMVDNWYESAGGDDDVYKDLLLEEINGTLVNEVLHLNESKYEEPEASRHIMGALVRATMFENIMENIPEKFVKYSEQGELITINYAEQTVVVNLKTMAAICWYYESYLGDKLDIEIGCSVDDNSLTFEEYIGIATH